jgi:hypothetical protein
MRRTGRILLALIVVTALTACQMDWRDPLHPRPSVKATTPAPCVR